MKIIWNGPVYDPSGYGSCARTYIRSLYERNVDIGVLPDRFFRGDHTKYLSQDIIDLIDSLLISNDTNFSDCIHIQHRTPNILTRVKAKKNVGYTVWETRTLPPVCANALNLKDILLTPSSFSASAIINSGFSGSVYVIPHIIDTTPFVESEKKLDDTKLVFLFNGEFTTRKGIDVLLESYMRAFSGDDDVVLVLKTYILDNMSNTSRYIPNYIDYIKERLKIKNCGEIKIIDQPISENMLFKLYKYSDVFLAPTRGEGFGLTIAEAMSHGNLVITTDKGGHRDFCESSNSLFIESSEVDIDVNMLERGRTVYKGQTWFDPNVDNFIAILKDVYDVFKQKGRSGFQSDFYNIRSMANKTVRDLFNADRVINKLMEVL